MSRVSLPVPVLATLLAQLPRCRCGAPGTSCSPASSWPVTSHYCDEHTRDGGTGFTYAWAVREALAALKAGAP